MNDNQYNDYQDRRNIDQTDRRQRPRPSRNDTDLIDDITKAIIGEAHAYDYYERLAQLAPNPRDRQTILEIQRDEARHYHWFSMILRRLGGRQPRIPPGESPRNFREGVRYAIRDELETSSFYRDIASRANDNMIRRQFMRASMDERRHANLFENMLRR